MEAHSDSMLAGKNIKDIYPDLEDSFLYEPMDVNEKNNAQVAQISKITDPDHSKHLLHENSDLKNQPEYKYFYRYILPSDIIYPLYYKTQIHSGYWPFPRTCDRFCL